MIKEREEQQVIDCTNPERSIIAERVIDPKYSCGYEIGDHYIDEIMASGYQYADHSTHSEGKQEKTDEFPQIGATSGRDGVLPE